MISMNTKFAVVATILFASAAWLFLTKPWETEVWVSTSADAFVTPSLGMPYEKIDPQKLAIGITPAPSPESAREIMRAAKQGKIVHVTIDINNEKLTFDIDGMSPNGNLLVNKATMSNLERVTEVLIDDDRGK
jgi:hypothetical protein